MKQETNNEIDLLLRRLSRRSGDLSMGTDHLDADELSSYAENALPAAARARYTEHLAECSKCRELIVQLSSAAGVVVAETSKAAEPSGLRKFLTSLFSPMVLRYAIPALGLIVVAVIGFAVFRTAEYKNAPTEVAYQREAPVATEQQPAPSAPSTLVDTPQKSASSATAPEVRADKSKETQPPPPNAPPAVSVTADVKTDARAQEPQQPVANEAPAQPAPKPTPVTEDAQKKLEAEAKKQETQDRAAAAPAAARQSDYQRARDENRPAPQVETSGSASAKSSPSPSDSKSLGLVGGLATAGRRADVKEKDSENAETRSVAGRRFRKKGGIWIDTAYDDGTTTNLTRGSEQYRALVADEPAIKKIADELGGQIIVVWKGRAYRIR